jgi:hypothetical protein
VMVRRMKIKTANVIFFFYFISVGIVLLGSSNTINNTSPHVWQIDPSVLLGLVGLITIVVSIIFILITLRSKETA